MHRLTGEYCFVALRFRYRYNYGSNNTVSLKKNRVSPSSLRMARVREYDLFTNIFCRIYQNSIVYVKYYLL